MVLTVPALYDTFRIKSRCKTPLSFKLWFPAANLKNICRGRCSHRPAGTHLPPNIPPQPSHHLKSQGRAFLHSPDFNLSSLWQHRTIPALRLKHRSDGCGTASAAPRSPYRHLELCGIALIILYTLYFGAINTPVRLSNQYRMPSIITTPFAIAPVMGSK